ncbi:hypothetical protein OUZ56_020289 [Daphnia magna]|uniref:Uncharacterized protein n=1 Tax=Daphnia magna TaxID=35525 RepID=A0ABQ9ZE31_9CRUS|nr:hypothetical protein OUZ56_020289 [Daphnia magna]
MKLKILLPGIQKVTLLRLKTPKRCLESGGNPLVSGLPLTSLRWNRKSLKDAHFLHLYINNIIIQFSSTRSARPDGVTQRTKRDARGRRTMTDTLATRLRDPNSPGVVGT